MKKSLTGFTIVELLIVIVVIAVLAAMTFVVFKGLQERAEVSALQSDLTQAAKQLSLDNTLTGSFPNTSSAAAEGRGLSSSAGASYQYTASGSTFCLTATKGERAYFITQSGAPQQGVCSGHNSPSSSVVVVADGSFIQTITTANCPTTRTRAVDARDSRTYWVAKLSDGKCWMLTNLSYSGSGTNTYGDSKAITNGTGIAATYTLPRYYVVPSSVNYTIEPNNPSTATNAAGQFGYLYNWCGAMGGQATAACANASTPTPDATISACPSGWKIPTAGAQGDFGLLNTAINNGSTSTDAGLRSVWLGQYSGFWLNGFTSQGQHANYWFSSQTAANGASSLDFYSLNVSLSVSAGKSVGMAVRCVAS